jgi:YbgC/YbaW family acyl-CoA thioester hydrolase
MRAQFEVGWEDVDYARVLYYARYYFFVDRAFSAWMHTHELYYRRMHEEWSVATPIVTSHCHYRGPLRLEDRLEVRLALDDLTERGYRINFQLIRLPEDALVAEGYTEHRFVDPAVRRPCAPPPPLSAVLEAMVAESQGNLAVLEPRP